MCALSVGIGIICLTYDQLGIRERQVEETAEANPSPRQGCIRPIAHRASMRGAQPWNTQIHYHKVTPGLDPRKYFLL
jgi:hypothetical protein